jgi:hypothetical protein
MRRLSAAAASRLPTDIKHDQYDEIMFEIGGPAGGEVHGDERVTAGTLAYLSGFELMMRGIPAKLIARRLNVEFGRVRGDAFAPTSTDTAQALVPYMDQIASVEDFGRFVHWQDDALHGEGGTHTQFRLFVWEDHLDRAFEVLRELNVPLSSVWHPYASLVAR